MVKIIKITRVEGMVLVTIDRFPGQGFGFNLKDIMCKDDLKNKLKAKLSELIEKEDEEKENKIKLEELKELEGQEL